MEASITAGRAADECEVTHTEWPAPREGELVGQGWTRRFTVPNQRCDEFVTLYESLGFEVLVEPVAPDLSREDCRSCQVVSCLVLKTIYTRPRQ